MSRKTSYEKTPTVFQMEATECGAASLTMILGYFGKFLPLEQMRVETGVSRDGCNAKYILRAARKYGLEAHGYRKEVEELLQLKPPCIIHWNFNHFVVFEGRKGKYIYINDPAVGRRKLTKQDIDDCFTGIVLTFTPTSEFQKEKKKKTLFTFVKQRLKGQYGPLATLLLIGLLLVFPGMLVPTFSQVFVDDILLGGNTEWTTALLVIMGVTVLLKVSLTCYRGMVLERLQNKMALISAHKFLTHMFRLPMNFFDQRYAGDLSGRVENNNSVSTFLAGDLATNVLNLFVAFFYLLLMILYNPLLSIIGIINVIFNVGIMVAGSKMIENETMKKEQDEGKLSGALLSGLSLTGTLKASGAENEYVGRLQGYYAKTTELEQKIRKKQEILNAIPQTANEITTVLVLLFGGLLVIQGQLTAGMLVAYNGLLESFTSPVNEIVGFVQKIQTLKSDMSRVEDIQKYEEDIKFKDIQKVPIERKLQGKVSLQNISFGYSPVKPPLVEEFNFELESGKSIAFVGASGCGKSTVSKIVSGLYMPWEGNVLFDGVDIRQIPKEILSSSVSTVSQDITLFSGSIRDNLTMWNKNIMDEDIINAAKDACIHNDITSKPDAYNFMLSEGGSNFSGGQRQRLEIARALVSNPSILIMDEATSALDAMVEKQIIDHIKRRGCTCIIVAHRLSAIRDCDEIIVMSHGKIVQRGTHDELAAQEGHYQRLIQNK